MGKAIRKITAVMLCAALLITAVYIGGSQKAAAEQTNQPVIYILGYNTHIAVLNAGLEDDEVTASFKTDKLIGLLKDNIDVFLKAFVTQDWSDFCKIIIDFMTDSFQYLRLDGNGEPVYESRTARLQNRDFVYGRMQRSPDLDQFNFHYDWRLDPTENMQALRDYIDLVLEMTGSETFSLCGRCEGACLAMTYYETYHDERMTDLTFYASALKGASPVGEAFSGNLYVDADALERYLNDTELGVDIKVGDTIEINDETIIKILKVASDVYGTDLVCWAVNNVYQQIYDAIIPEALRASFGSFPGFWAMVEDKYYEQAKELVFGGVEDEYAGLIQKIDNYHYNYMNRADEIIKEASENGVRVVNVVKYGKQPLPVIEDADILSDGICKVYNASLGATCTKIGETFSDEYIAAAESRYISPDKCIDASTCMFPETTWFIKDLHHNDFPKVGNAFVYTVTLNHDMTVTSDALYPQYNFYTPAMEFDYELGTEVVNGTIEPYSVDKQSSRLDEYNENTANSFIRKIKPFFSFLFKITTFFLKLITPKAKV